MAQISNILTIDVNKDIIDIITAKQGDANSRFLDVRVVDAGMPINLNRHTVRFSAVKPDGHRVYNNCVITDSLNGRFQAELTNQILAVKGYVRAEFTLFGSDEKQVLTTKTFNILVQGNLFDETAVESTNEFGAAVILFQDVAAVRDIIFDNLDVPVSTRASQISLDKVQLSVNELISINNTSSIFSAVKSVQRGTFVVSYPNRDNNFTIASVNPDKSLVVLTSQQLWSLNGSTGFTRFVLTSDTNVYVGVSAISSGWTFVFDYQIIEFY